MNKPKTKRLWLWRANSEWYRVGRNWYRDRKDGCLTVEAARHLGLPYIRRGRQCQIEPNDRGGWRKVGRGEK